MPTTVMGGVWASVAQSPPMCAVCTSRHTAGMTYIPGRIPVPLFRGVAGFASTASVSSLPLTWKKVEVAGKDCIVVRVSLTF